MAPKAPTWHAGMIQGFAPGVQLRAVHVLLELTSRRTLSVDLGHTDPVWGRLLSLGEQQQLYHVKAAEKVRIGAGQALITPSAAPLSLVLTDADHVHVGISEDAWVGLITGGPLPRTGGTKRSVAAGQKSWQLGTGSRSTMVAGPSPDSSEPWPLPWPVHSTFFEKDVALSNGLLWIASPSDPEQLLGRLAEVCQRFGPKIYVFDAYGRLDRAQWRAALPEGAEVLGMADAQARKAFFRRCHCYMVDSAHSEPSCRAPDPFAIEAACLGLKPWQQDVDRAFNVDTIVDVKELMDHLLPVMEGRGHKANHQTIAKSGKMCTVCTELEPQGSAVSRALMLYGPLPDAEHWQALANAISAKGYAIIFAQVGPHTTFLPAMMMAHLRRPTGSAPHYQHEETLDALSAQAAAWFEQAAGGANHTALDVLVPSSNPTLVRQARDLQSSLIAGQESSAGPLPVIAMDSPHDIRLAGASQTQVGASVASSDIVWGTYHASKHRFVAKWLSHAGKDYDVASLFMHSLTRKHQANAEATQSLQWSAATLRLALTHDKVDGIFMSMGPLAAQVHALRCAYARRPVALVSVVHGLQSPLFQHQMASYLLNGPLYPFDSFISPSVCGKKAMLHLWRSLREWLLSQGHREVSDVVDVAVIPYGVDVTYFASRQQLSCRQNLALPMHELLILSLGRIARRFKTCLLPLLLSMQQLKLQGVRAKLIIAGSLSSPHEHERLKEAVRALGLTEWVHYKYSVDLEQKAQLLSAADIFVALSDTCQETHGIAPIEAMAAGLPVVASAWNGFSEIVVHEDTGFLIPTAWTDIPPELFLDNHVDKRHRDLGYDDLHETVATDIYALTQALATLCKSPDLRKAMGERGRARAHSHYDAAKQGQRIAEHLLHKVAVAKTYEATFTKPELLMPMDRLDQRFAHYPTHWLSPDTVVALGPMAQDAAHRRMVTQYIGAPDAEEASIIDEIVERAASGPQTMGSLLSPRIDMLRLMRCLKYDILHMADRSP